MTPLAATEAERAYQAALTTYPNPNSPHGSVNERWRDDVKAYIVGYLAARALQQTAEPNFWAVLADHGDDFTGDKELADYWDRKGRTVVALYRAAPDRAPSTDSAADACAWHLADKDNGIWESSCGEAWSFIDGGPKENRVSFCHHCGKRAAIAASLPQTKEE